jgi:2-polyprenyl-6-hydroxyphenyl methylase/3-demethylubiquinone-9 3-methyltransferase
MKDYYSKKLSAGRLRQVYEIASPRVKQYLDAEIDFVLERIAPGDRVLELGCGYGRVLEKLIARVTPVFGIDTSLDSLLQAKQAPGGSNYRLAVMNAVHIAVGADCFDVAVCIQNGISAFNVNRKDLMAEAVRITRPGGTVLFSSYADLFWPERLAWFRRQAARGLLGEIDEEATGNGVIVCKDGFQATTVGPEDFKTLAAKLGILPEISIVDESSVFCKITAPY